MDHKHSTQLPELFIFPPSITAETGRWLLAHYGIEYNERPNTPICSVFKMLRFWRFTMPILVTKLQKLGIRPLMEFYDGTADEKLKLTSNTHPETVDKIWQDYDALRLNVARFMYFYVLPNKELGNRLLAYNTPKYQTSVNRIIYPFTRWALGITLGLNTADHRRAYNDIMSFLESVENKMLDGRPYLSGDTFGLEDLLFSSATAPLVLPDEHGAEGAAPQLMELPQELQEHVLSFRERPFGQYILKIYAEKRHQKPN